MFVEIKNNVDRLSFEDFSAGDLFVYDNKTFIVLAYEIFDSNSDKIFNAVNVKTGELDFFSAKCRVICPNDHILTVEL